MVDWDLMAADRMAMAEGLSRWAVRMAAVAARAAASVIMVEIASRARLRTVSATGEPVKTR